MISNFFNYASMNPVKTVLIGVGVALATPYVLPWLMPSLVSPVASLAQLFSILAMGTGAVYAGDHLLKGAGPAANSATANGGKIALSGLGVGVAAPYVAPLLGSLGAPAFALASVFAPAALVIGGALLAVHLAKPLFRTRAPQHA